MSEEKRHPLANILVSEKPTTESHNEFQDRINKEREQHLASLPPEIRVKYEKLHEAAAILNGEKIPFYLCAVVEEKDGKPVPMDYSRFCYKYEPYDKNDEASRCFRSNLWAIAGSFLRQFSLGNSFLRMFYVLPNGENIGYWNNGQFFNAPKVSENKLTDDTPKQT